MSSGCRGSGCRSSGSGPALLTLLAVTIAGVAIDYHFSRSGAKELALVPIVQAAAGQQLRVCADPNNLPFSNSRGNGCENALAQLVAEDLGRTVRYTWWPQRRGFIRRTLKAGRCDVVMGVPASFELARTTVPYYRSSYMFVTRHDRDLHLRSLDDPRLHHLRIGLHVIGDDYDNVPPAQALAARGIVDNVVGYSIYGDYSQPEPWRSLLDAVARNEVDVAIAWGPLAGYFVQHEPVTLEMAPVPSTDAVHLPMAFDISMGVRRDDVELERSLERVLVNRRQDIRQLLVGYGVPLESVRAVARTRLDPDGPEGDPL